VILINETLARRFFLDREPLGQRLHVGLNDMHGEIIGVVGDVRDHGLNREAAPEFYLPYRQLSPDSMSLVIRAKTIDPNDLAASLRSVVREIDKELPLSQVQTMGNRLSDSLRRQRFSMTLLTALAGLALALAVIGIFSVMSLIVTQRTQEIGIRMALGANRVDLLRMVIFRGMKLTMVGLSIGLVLSFALTRLMKDFLYQVKTTDPTTFVIVSLILVGTALIACGIPAQRATKVDPMVALRNE